MNPMNIGLEEIRALAPRVALYVGVAYLTVRAIKFGVNSAATLLGVSSTKNDCCN